MSIQNTERFNESLQRLTSEVRTIRCDFAALAAFRARRKEYFRSELITLLFNGLTSDLMARLSRVSKIIIQLRRFGISTAAIQSGSNRISMFPSSRSLPAAESAPRHNLLAHRQDDGCRS